MTSARARVLDHVAELGFDEVVDPLPERDEIGVVAGERRHRGAVRVTVPVGPRAPAADRDARPGRRTRRGTVAGPGVVTRPSATPGRAPAGHRPCSVPVDRDRGGRRRPQVDAEPGQVDEQRVEVLAARRRVRAGLAGRHRERIAERVQPDHAPATVGDPAPDPLQRREVAHAARRGQRVELCHHAPAPRRPHVEPSGDHDQVALRRRPRRPTSGSRGADPAAARRPRRARCRPPGPARSALSSASVAPARTISGP